MTPEQRVETAEALSQLTVDEIRTVAQFAQNMSPQAFLDAKAAQRLGSSFG